MRVKKSEDKRTMHDIVMRQQVEEREAPRARIQEGAQPFRRGDVAQAALEHGTLQLDILWPEVDDAVQVPKTARPGQLSHPGEMDFSKGHLSFIRDRQA
jgi:hypothetical protein